MDYLDERHLHIFTDGSSYSGPGRAGVGIRFVFVGDDGHEHSEDYPLAGYDGATSQQAELAAVVEGLRAVVTRRAPADANRYERITVWTDSEYIVNGYSSARFSWQSNGWVTSDGNPVANAPQWKELLKLASRTGKPVAMKWVKGHKKSTHNKAVDKLAKRSASDRTGRHLSIVKVRRKLSEASVEIGSVAMSGQRLTIRIVTDEFLPVQRMNRYKYEAISRGSPFRRCVDMIFSEAHIQLNAGHTYYVRVNSETSAPRVLRLFREL